MRSVRGFAVNQQRETQQKHVHCVRCQQAHVSTELCSLSEQTLRRAQLTVIALLNLLLPIIQVKALGPASNSSLPALPIQMRQSQLFNYSVSKEPMAQGRWSKGLRSALPFSLCLTPSWVSYIFITSSVNVREEKRLAQCQPWRRLMKEQANHLQPKK